MTSTWSTADIPSQAGRTVVVTGANQDNDFVSFVYGTSKFFVFGLGDVFTPNDATIGVVLNYSLAALVYVALGRIVARGLRR